MTRLVVSASHPERALLDQAARVIRAGGVVALPTDTLYGLAADPFSDRAVNRIFSLKGRSSRQPLPLIAFDVAQVRRQLGNLTPLASMLAERFWPGPLTLVIEGFDSLSHAVTAGTGRVGVRVPNHRVARGLCEACGHPLTATSANVSGEAPAVEPRSAVDALPDVDIVLDAGPAAGGLPSTIVDVTGPDPRLIRAGAIPWEEVLAVWRERG
jgi:L-threonylcarbamoyladenylate synthase